MSRRGDTLREHILWTAREVFLEVGFERASMDVVAARAGTSKTSLYAHFESKEKLFGAFLDLIGEVVLHHLGTPGDHPGPPGRALVAFCGRYLELLVSEKAVQLCRLVLAEATRFPQGPRQLYDAVFTQVEVRLTAYLRTTAGLSPSASARAAQQLIGQLLYPRYQRALFGIDPLAKSFDPATLAKGIDLKPIRAAVANVLASAGEP